MPSALQSLIGTTPQGSILLIEEYDALAAAIGSALKKFAPQHVTHVARSLTEAKALAKGVDPDLFVIDFDPGYPGLTEFLQKIRSAHPDARVLIIGGSIPGETAANRRSFGALQFVGKPFEVADFGAAVQALLGPWKDSETANSRGSLRSLSLADVVLAQCAGKRSVRIEVKQNAEKSGEIHVWEGQVSHAETGRHSGPEALQKMLVWPGAEMREREKPTSRRTIERAEWAPLLLEALREIKAQRPAPPEKVPLPKPPAKTGKKIVAIDDTDMLLIFVEDVLATADPQLQITTALNGKSGLKEIERVMPDLVLLDYSLPDINGDEICRQLLQNDRTARIPVLMMSGHVPELAQAAAAFENVTATIAKPFLSEAFIDLVQKTLSAKPLPARKAAPVVEPTKAPPPLPKAAVEQPSRRSRARKRSKPAPTAPSLPPKEPVQPAAAAPAKAPPLQPSKPTPAAAPSLVPKVPPRPAPPAPAKAPPLPPSLPAEEPRRPAQVAKGEPLVPPPSPPIDKPPRLMDGEHVESKPRVAPSPTITPPEPATVAKISAPVVSNGKNDVVLGLFLEVAAMQLTPELRMGAIRARPYSLTVSLHVPSPTLRATLSQTGFQLGRVALDGNGRIATVRLIPTLQPFKAAETRKALQIGAVALVPINSKERIQLTSAANAPMTMQLLAHLEIAGVELSDGFQVAQLVLKNRNNTVRVTLDSQAIGQEEAGAAREIAAVRLDHSGQIAELLLQSR